MTDPELTRRLFLGVGASVAAGCSARAATTLPVEPHPIDNLEPYYTSQADFRDVSRGTPLPHTLPDDKKKTVGMTRETWSLEVIADPEQPAKLGKPMSKAAGTAFDFPALMKLAETRAVRFAKVMTCLNIGCPLGMGVWEGVPLRDVVWLAKPTENLRRIFYYGYHNDDPKQIFRSSLPAGRVLEDYDDLPPVILCYKLNGEWLTSERGGPVRIVVPEAYGFKSVKWLSHVVLSNLPHANDTYANGNNDLDSPLKTFAAMFDLPANAKVMQPIPVSGYAQVGVSGLSKVQVWVSPAGKSWPSDDPYFTAAPWVDTAILPPVKLPEALLGKPVHGFDADGRPKNWPMKLTKIHWTVVLAGLPVGDYTVRCRTVDAHGTGQPMPRPFAKSGRCSIEAKKLTIV